MMALNFSLNPKLHTELEAAARDCQITAREFVGQCVEAILAERRLPHVKVGSHGAFTSGYLGVTHHEDADEDEDQDVEIIEHKILL